MVTDLHQEGSATMRLIKTSIIYFWADSILPLILPHGHVDMPVRD